MKRTIFSRLCEKSWRIFVGRIVASNGSKIAWKCIESIGYWMESVLRRCLVHGELIKVHLKGDEKTTENFLPLQWWPHNGYETEMGWINVRGEGPTTTISTTYFLLLFFLEKHGFPIFKFFSSHFSPGFRHAPVGMSEPWAIQCSDRKLSPRMEKTSRENRLCYVLCMHGRENAARCIWELRLISVIRCIVARCSGSKEKLGSDVNANVGRNNGRRAIKMIINIKRWDDAINFSWKLLW